MFVAFLLMKSGRHHGVTVISRNGQHEACGRRLGTFLASAFCLAPSQNSRADVVRQSLKNTPRCCPVLRHGRPARG